MPRMAMADTAGGSGVESALEIGDERRATSSMESKTIFERARERDIAELVPAYLTNVGAYQGCRLEPRRLETTSTTASVTVPASGPGGLCS
jgi:hypothetical protein